MQKYIIAGVIIGIVVLVGTYAFSSYLVPKSSPLKQDTKVNQSVQTPQPNQKQPQASSLADTSKDYLIVNSQKSGSTIIITEVNLLKGGYVVVHKVNQDNAIGGNIGNSKYLAPGKYTNVEVPLYGNFSFKPGDKALANILVDDGDQTFGKADTAITDEAGNWVKQEFSLQ